jgi:4-amino-4-deoxy-L-arabinose transferase-like glycosyltransferase
MNDESLRRQKRGHLLLLALIVAFAALLRFFSLSGIGFWTDELCSLSAADGRGLELVQVPANCVIPPLPCCTRLADARSAMEIPSRMGQQDTHPPLYFMLLRLWEDVSGDSEFAVRSLNVVFSLLAIVLLYFVAVESVGSSAALVACLLMAVATPQIQYAQEARNYMCALVFTLVAALSIQHLQRSSPLRWSILLAVSLLAMMLTHYLCVGVACGLAIYALFTLPRRARWHALVAMVIAGLLFVSAWGPSLLRQGPVFAGGLAWLSDSGPGHLQRRAFDLLRLPVRTFVEVTDPNAQGVVAAIGLIMLLALAPLFAFRRELRLYICWWICGVGIVAIADLTRSTTQLNWVRYTLFATPAAYVLLAAAIQRGRWKFVLSGTAILMSILCLNNAYVPAWKTDLRAYVQIVAKHREQDDGLLIVGQDRIKDAVFYAAVRHYMPVAPKTALLTQMPDPALVSAFQGCPRVQVLWLYPDQPKAIQGFHVLDQTSFSYFAVLQSGTFAADTH